MELLRKASELHQQGFAVIPTGQNKNGLDKGWQNMVGDNRQEPNGNFNRPAVKGIGIVTGAPVGDKFLIAVDVDCYDKAISREMCNYISELTDTTVSFRVGSAPKFLVPMLCTHNTNKMLSKKFYDGSRVEVLGKGQQFVAYGHHPEAGKYKWYNGDLNLDTLPTVDELDLIEIISRFENLMTDAGYAVDQPASSQTYDDDDFLFDVKRPPLGLSEVEIRLTLAKIDVMDLDYDEWVRVGQALHHEAEGKKAGFDIWCEWSARDERYKPNEMPHKWSSFGNSDREVTFATVLKMAKDRDDPSTLSDDPITLDTSTPSTSRFQTADELLQAGIKPPQWIIKGMLERDSLAMMYGQSGGGKSYVALRMATAIARGTTFHNHATKQGTVVYMCGEGYRGVLARLKAIMLHDHVDTLGNLYLTNRITDFSSADDIKATVKEIKDAGIEPDFVIIDTLARASGGLDENSTSDMNKFVKACDFMRKKLNGASILPVHHTGKGDKTVARGSSVLRAAMDVEIMVEPVEGGITVASTKAKDGEPFETLGFSFARVNFGQQDEDGEELYSHVIVPSEAVLADSTKSKKLTPSGAKVLKSFDDMWASDEPRIDAPQHFIDQFGMDAPTEGFWISDLKSHIRSANSHEKDKTLTSIISRGISDAIDKEILAVWDDVVVKL